MSTTKNPNHTLSLKDDKDLPKHIHKDTKLIINWLGRYHRGMETKDFVYFINYQEGDENACVKMFRKNSEVKGKLEVASTNYFAYGAMYEDILAENYTYLSPSMKNNIKLDKEINK